ncbi:MAG: hypothetical protein WDO15_22340 [Bacteroidota bacterium]
MAQVRLGARNGHSYQDNLLTDIMTANKPDSASLRNTSTTDLSNNVDANLTYTHLFDQAGKEFSVMTSLEP